MIEPLSPSELDEIEEYAKIAASKQGVFFTGQPERILRLVEMARKLCDYCKNPTNSSRWCGNPGCSQKLKSKGQ